MSTPERAKAIRVHMWADLVCPWCAIGRRRLSVAIESRPHVDVEVMWRPFQLHPDWPARGRSWTEFTTERWGSPSLARPVFARVEEVAAADGLAFDFTRIPRVPHTADLHRLVLHAQSAGAPWAVVDALADAYFSGRVDVTDRGALAEVVAGTTDEAVDSILAILDSRAYVDEVLDAGVEARALGVRGVPFFVLDGRLALSGAQPAPVLAAALDEASRPAATTTD